MISESYDLPFLHERRGKFYHSSHLIGAFITLFIIR
jgi:hypothetical protein